MTDDVTVLNRTVCEGKGTLQQLEKIIEDICRRRDRDATMWAYRLLYYLPTHGIHLNAEVQERLLTVILGETYAMVEKDETSYMYITLIHVTSLRIEQKFSLFVSLCEMLPVDKGKGRRVGAITEFRKFSPHLPVLRKVCIYVAQKKDSDLAFVLRTYFNLSPGNFDLIADL